MTHDNVISPHRISLELTTNQLGTVQLAAWVFAPVRSEHEEGPAIWLYCIPGSTYRGLAYYDRQVPGMPAETYSMARYMVKHGIGVIAIDNLGTGESPVQVSGNELTHPVYAEAYMQAVSLLRRQIITGSLLPEKLAPVEASQLWFAGVGQSMGAFILTALQGTYAACDGVVLMSWPQTAVEFSDEVAQQLATTAVSEDGHFQAGPAMRKGIHDLLYSHQVPQELVVADTQDCTTIPIGLLGALGIPGIVREDASKINVDTYLAFAGVDVASRFYEEPGMYTSAPSISFLLQSEAHHAMYFEPSRFELWHDMAAWCHAKAEQQRLKTL